MTRMLIKVDKIEVFGSEAIDFINERLTKDLKGTNNTIEVIRATTEQGSTVFEIETDLCNLSTITEYLTKFINRRKRFINARTQIAMERYYEQVAQETKEKAKEEEAIELDKTIEVATGEEAEIIQEAFESNKTCVEILENKVTPYGYIMEFEWERDSDKERFVSHYELCEGTYYLTFSKLE